MVGAQDIVMERCTQLLLVCLVLITTLNYVTQGQQEFEHSVQTNGTRNFWKIYGAGLHDFKSLNGSDTHPLRDRTAGAGDTDVVSDKDKTKKYVAEHADKYQGSSSLGNLIREEKRIKFRQRRGAEDQTHVLHLITKDTIDFQSQSNSTNSSILDEFNTRDVFGSANFNIDATRLEPRGLLHDGDFDNKNASRGGHLPSEVPEKNSPSKKDIFSVVDLSLNFSSNRDVIAKSFDNSWDLPSENSDLKVQASIELLGNASTNPEDLSWDGELGKTKDSVYGNTIHDPHYKNQLSTQEENFGNEHQFSLHEGPFEDIQQFSLEEDLLRDAEQFSLPEDPFNDRQQFSLQEDLAWVLANTNVSTEDERFLNFFQEHSTESPGVWSSTTPTEPLVLPNGTQLGCQMQAPPPVVDECGYKEEPEEPGVHLVSLRWREVGIYFTITAFVIFAGLGKMVFHKMHWLSSRVPESCLLIVLGVLMGLLVHFAGGTDSSDKCKSAVSFPTFSSQVFFMVLLPPIILEAAYSLHDRCFIDNLGTVLVFAVFGTLMNVFLVGLSLWGLAVVGGMGEITISLTESLVFAALISAVDPVAVLSIFQELGVNKGLYFLVFGESLLNDGVTVVVYNMFSVYMEMETIKASDYVLSVVAFFVVVAGGTLIGLMFGVLTALITKYTDTVRVVEPLALLGLSYLAYITAEIFHFSGIISLIVTGLVQAQYAYPNISQKSYTTVKYFIKMASATSDTIIFMFLGMVLVHDRHVWQTGFVLWTLVLCFVARLLVTLLLAVVTNCHRLHPIGIAEQLILAYGGLRGAVAFSLVSMLPETFEHKELFITATLVVIIFTVFVQGITVGPMVNFLNVTLSATCPQQLLQEVNVKVVDTMMAGIEEVIGRVGDNKVRENLKSFNEKYFMKWLTIPSKEDNLTKLFEKIAITEHYANLYGPSILIERTKVELSVSRQDLTMAVSPFGSHFCSVQNIASAQSEMRTHSSLGASLRALGGSLRRHAPSSSRKSSMAVSATGSRGSDIHTREDDARTLLKAINNNAFNKLHYTYNQNLVDMENQDMNSHMNWRREHAKRLALLAQIANNRPESPVGEGEYWMEGNGGTDLPYEFELHSRELAADIPEGVSLLADSRNLDAIMRYHRRHNIRKRSLRLGAPEADPTRQPNGPDLNLNPGQMVLNIKNEEKKLSQTERDNAKL